MNEAESALSEEYKVTKSSRSPRKLLPKLKISNLNVDDIESPTDLKNKILSKNRSVAAALENGNQSRLDVLFIDKKTKNAVIKVTPDVRETILSSKRIFLNMESHTVTDSLHVEQCYHCQGFGHRSGSDRCPRKDTDPICLFCAGTHRSSTCRNKSDRNKHKCSNCLKSNVRETKANAKTHRASDKTCPSYEK